MKTLKNNKLNEKLFKKIEFKIIKNIKKWENLNVL